MKNSKKSLMHVLSMSILLSLSSTSFAELVNNPSSGSTGTASLNWSAADASQLLNDEDDEPTPTRPTTPSLHVAKRAIPGWKRRHVTTWVR